ncbi:MAG: hypothetical protein WD768_07030 [Phycisphaeraceae bacterium]
MLSFTRQFARFAWLATAVVICACNAADAAALPQAMEPKAASDAGAPAIGIAKDREVNSRSVARGQDREGDLRLHTIDRDGGTAPAWLAQHATNRKAWALSLDPVAVAADPVVAPAFVPQQLPLPPPTF